MVMRQIWAHHDRKQPEPGSRRVDSRTAVRGSPRAGSRRRQAEGPRHPGPHMRGWRRGCSRGPGSRVRGRSSKDGSGSIVRFCTALTTASTTASTSNVSHRISATGGRSSTARSSPTHAPMPSIRSWTRRWRSGHRSDSTPATSFASRRKSPRISSRSSANRTSRKCALGPPPMRGPAFSTQSPRRSGRARSGPSTTPKPRLKTPTCSRSPARLPVPSIRNPRPSRSIEAS